MSEEVNSVSFFFGLLLSRKANLSNSWRRVSLSSRSPPPPHFLRTNKLLLSLTHTLSGSFQFLLFSRVRQEHNTSFSPTERRKKGNLNSFLSLRAISVTVSWRLWERRRGRKKKGDRGEGASRFWQGGGKEEEGGNTERLFFLHSCVTRNVFSSRRRLN